MRTGGRRLATLAVLALAGVALPAQKQAARPGPAPHTPPVAGREALAPPESRPRGPALLAQVTPERPAEPLALSRLGIDVTVAGFLARTRVTMTFRNETGRVLEGELVFPLPEGAAVSGYALDVGGRLVDAVVVEREAARVAFESEVRRGVDPGLVEWVRGNNFRTRVYPVPPHGGRTVRVDYVSELVTEGQGASLAALYQLPLRTPETVPELELRIEVDRPGPAPEVRSGGLPGLGFSAWQGRWVAEARRQEARLDQDLLVALPEVEREGLAVEVGPDGGFYFTLDDFPPLPETGAAAAPRRVGLLWDASLSRARADRARERALLRRWLEGLRNVDVELTLFRDQPEPARMVSVREGDAGELLRLLETAPCDGGTDLSRLRFPAGVAYTLLVGDGLATLGSGLPPAAAAPVYALSADPTADHALLRRWAESSGGAYFNLGRVADATVLAALGRPAFSLLSVEREPGSVAELLPAGVQPVLAGRVSLAGRLVADEARLTLRYGLPGKPPTLQRTVVVRRGGGVTGLVPLAWAQRKAGALAAEPDRNRQELLALGRKFGLVTPGTSLLVLETLEQHLRHGVEPPASRPELRRQYQQAVAARQAQDVAKRRDKLERVVALWQERVRWWQTEFRPRPTRQVTADRRGQPRADDLRSVDLALPEEAGVPGGIEGEVPGGVVGGVVGGLPAVPDVARHARQEVAAAATTAMKSVAGGNRQPGPSATITVKPWDPETPYLAAMEEAGAERAYAVYLAQRERYLDSPSFYLDCADLLLRLGRRELGRRVLTSVAELRLDDARLLRVAAHRLQQIGEIGLALELFERVRHERGEEPQSLRDLALAFAARGEARREQARPDPRAVAQDYLRALELLDELVRREWDGRFPEIETVALMDANRLLAIFEREHLPGAERIPLDPRLRQLLDVDVRIVLTWDTDQTDMDLWVTEPGGEKCDYGHPSTSAGGRMSRDFTGGYGPEEYLARRGQSGEYLVQANFYGSRAQSLTGPTTLQATVITGFGRPDEKREALTLRLGTARDVVEVGRVRFTGAPDRK